jgi:hypothetical protein
MIGTTLYAKKVYFLIADVIYEFVVRSITLYVTRILYNIRYFMYTVQVITKKKNHTYMHSYILATL